MNRRDFIFSAGAATALAGCRSLTGFGVPNLRFGVVSDIHVTTPKSCRMLEKSLRHFKSRGVDAVMIPGDLTDWGLRAEGVPQHDDHAVRPRQTERRGAGGRPDAANRSPCQRRI